MTGSSQAAAGGNDKDPWKKADEGMQEPDTLEIEYQIEVPPDEEADEGEKSLADSNQMVKVKEVVFQDPTEAHTRPRLLVPLQSVLGLKSLCEREFVRIEAITNTLNECRTSYYKELLYLREQLILAADPENHPKLANLQNFEVYFYDPPKYVDDELKEFMLNCIRWTNKKVIDENYELQMRLAGMEDVFANVDFCIKSLLKKMGTSKFFSRMHNIVKVGKDIVALAPPGAKPPDNDDEKKVLSPAEELEAAILEAYPKFRPKEDNSDVWRAEIEERDKVIQQLRKELAETKEQLAEEKRRAEEALARFREAERRLSQVKEPEEAAPVEVFDTGDLDGKIKSQAAEIAALKKFGESSAKRIRKAYEDIAKEKNVAIGAEPPALPNAQIPDLDKAISGMEKIMKAVAAIPPEKEIVTVQAGSSAPVTTQDPSLKKEIAQLKKEIEALKKQVEDALEAERRAREEIKELQQKLSDAEAKADAALSRGNSKGGEDNSADLERLQRIIEKKKERIVELEAEVEQVKAELKKETRRADEQERLLNEARRMDADRAKQMAELMAKLRAAEEEAEQLGVKLFRAQEKIAALKLEIKEWKRRCGVDVNSDDEDSDDEDDLPAFMVRYYVRVKNSAKPRWMLLSEDAKLSKQKKEYLFNQKFHSVNGQAVAMNAANALEFLRNKPQELYPDMSGKSHKKKNMPILVEDPWQGAAMAGAMGGHVGTVFVHPPPQPGQQPRGRSRSPPSTPGQKTRTEGPALVQTPIEPAASPSKPAPQAKAFSLQQQLWLSQGQYSSPALQSKPQPKAVSPTPAVQPAPTRSLATVGQDGLSLTHEAGPAPLERNLFAEVHQAPETIAENRILRGGNASLQPIPQSNWSGMTSSPNAQSGSRGAAFESSQSKENKGSRSPSPAKGVSSAPPSDRGQLMVSGRADPALSPSNSVLSTSLSSGRIDLSSSVANTWRKSEAKSDGGSTRAPTEQPTPAVSRQSPKAPKPPPERSVAPPPMGSAEFASTVSGSMTPTRLSPAKPPSRQRGFQAAQTSPDFRSQGHADLEANSLTSESHAERARRLLADSPGNDPTAQVLAWAGNTRSQAVLPLTNVGPKGSVLKSHHGFGGKSPQSQKGFGMSHSVSSSAIDTGPPEYITTDTLPRLPGAKVRKAAPRLF
eukprot:CAMPEP_0197620708 /NCGR_PEP_ID=MMETSP1338-20131121/1486_1 /TAXON_ID=43686 ORGANISM="Pelagodinium beii, Strain RCC1491" /NCGR_SAMPLE_ID=MMETSP1338 /ASSEMBLY_ACC=CAM_ASM_000754 /LENGTH=1155 /DNA_ID=CAMNT_0043189969 /DNA_START=157 /DNA_END=3624 /DNA_ORIENTATION=-